MTKNGYYYCYFRLVPWCQSKAHTSITSYWWSIVT